MLVFIIDRCYANMSLCVRESAFILDLFLNLYIFEYSIYSMYGFTINFFLY